MKHELSKERLEEIAADGFVAHGEIKAMARALLAAHEQEPYGYAHKYIYKTLGSCVLSSDHEAYRNTNGDHIPLYRHPAPVMEREQEPVAWRYRFVHTPKSLEHGSPFTTDWVLTESEDDCNPSDCFERQPLYTRPAPSIPAAVPEDDADLVKAMAFLRETSADAQMEGWLKELRRLRAAMLQSEPVKAVEPIYEYYPDNGWSECNSKEHYEELTALGHRTRIVYAAPQGV